MTYTNEPDWTTLAPSTDVLVRRVDGTEEFRGVVAGPSDDGLLVHDYTAERDEHGHARARLVTPAEWMISRAS